MFIFEIIIIILLLITMSYIFLFPQKLFRKVIRKEFNSKGYSSEIIDILADEHRMEEMIIDILKEFIREDMGNIWSRKKNSSYLFNRLSEKEDISNLTSAFMKIMSDALEGIINNTDENKDRDAKEVLIQIFESALSDVKSKLEESNKNFISGKFKELANEFKRELEMESFIDEVVKRINIKQVK